MDHGAHFPDTTYTRPTTVDALVDTCNWPGLALLLAGILALGSTLSAPGNGDWLLIGVVTSALCLAAGVAVVLFEQRHARASHHDRLSTKL